MVSRGRNGSQKIRVWGSKTISATVPQRLLAGWVLA
jgi:hypothetical protein